MSRPTFVFIGCGNMGAALVSGALQSLPEGRTVGIDPDLARARGLLPPGAKVDLYSDTRSLAGLKPDLVVLAVKPQGFKDLDRGVMAVLAGAPIVSIMAGIPLAALTERIGHRQVIRVMPNLPAVIGAGMSLGCAAFDAVTPDVRGLVETLFGTLGHFEWAEDEAMFELASPVFACGPGFVFAFAEQMVQAATAAGLSAPLADRLVRQTFLGSARMLAEDPRSAAQMKQAVTSPNGTTQAGLAALEAPGALPAVIPDMLARARRRAAELAAQA